MSQSSHSTSSCQSPSSGNVAVLGAGIIGLMNAYVLCRAGFSVTLYDPCGFPADNASFKAGGMLAPYSEIEHMDLGWVRAGLKGIQAWADLQAALEVNFDFHAAGSLLVAHSQDRYILERFRSHLPGEAGQGVAPADLEPALEGRFAAGLYLGEEAHLYPKRVMQALCGFLSDQISFRPVAREPDALSGQYDWVLDCRGMGAAEAAPDLRGVKGELAVVRNAEFSLHRPVRLMHPRYPLYIVPRPDHLFMIGATVIEADDDEQVSLRSSMELMSALYSLHPSFGDAKILELTAGIRPSYADNLPQVRQEANVISCNGTFRHGYLFAPALADCALGMICGQKSEFEDLLTGGKHDGPAGQDHHQRAA